MQPDGAVAIDDSSTLYWSQAMLEDELAHDADLDMESLYTIHAVHDCERTRRVCRGCTRTVSRNSAHSTSTCSQPSPVFVANCGDPIRALAFAALEGSIGS